MKIHDRQMEPDELNYSSLVNCDSDSRSAVNSLVLDYYKKFGRKRDLEHYFSLSTAQSELRDPSGLFWRRMKTAYDSDSGEKRSESSTELCRISIKCSVPDEGSYSQNENNPSEPVKNEKNESDSPPIVNEERAEVASHKSDNDSLHSDDNAFQKSSDNILDTSTNKPLSPTSSINSQRKLEWDSLADVGYANEEDQRTSISTLSTLERLALQYSNSDNSKPISNIGPTAHSTPIEETQPNKSKANKKHLIKSTKYCKKDVDFVQVNVPENAENVGRAINVSLTKNISFNITDNDCVVTSENAGVDTKITAPNMVSVETEVTPELKFDKEIQTSLTKHKSFRGDNDRLRVQPHKKKSQRHVSVPVMINLNTLRRRVRNKKIKAIRKKTKETTKETTGIETVDNFSLHDKSGAPVSEAESFEYMPGHMYNQNQQRDDYSKNKNSAGNKSSLESSSRITTESSKGSNYSFTKELERSIDQLKNIVDQRQKDTNIKRHFVKKIVEKLVSVNFRDDVSGPELFEPRFNSKILNLCQGDYTTSTSDLNTVTDVPKHKPRKSILRTDKFDTNVSSITQSVPNLSSMHNTDKPMTRKLEKSVYCNSESDGSNRSKQSSETTKTSSEELFLQYIKALRKEQAYKMYLKEKEMFLKQKLTGIEYFPRRQKLLRPNQKKNSLKELIKDLSLNNYDGGSGDANGHANVYSENNAKFNAIRKQKSHSVFTLSTGQSNKKDISTEKLDLKSLQECLKPTQPKTQSRDLDDQCCPQHCIRKSATNTSEQVNIAHDPTNEDCARNRYSNAHCICPLIPQTFPGDIKYVCLCTEVASGSKDCCDNVFVYKCSCLGSQKTFESHATDPVTLQCGDYKHQYRNDFPKKIKTVRGSINIDNLTKPMKTSTITQPYHKVADSVTGNKCSYESVCAGTSSSRENQSQFKDDSKKQKLVVQHTKRKKEPIAMCSRQVQTDLMIDLKASDPTLSDVNYVYDDVRVNFKAKHKIGDKTEGGCDQKNRKNNYVTYSNSSSSTTDSTHVEVSSSKSRLSLQSRLSVEDFLSKTDKKKSSETICGINTAETSDVTICPSYSEPAESRENLNDENKNLKIHVQDTDMMVMIDNENKTLDIPATGETIKTDKVHKGVVTDSIYYDEKATSLQNECSKDVQACIDELGLDTLIEDVVERRMSTQPDSEKTVKRKDLSELTKLDNKLDNNENYFEIATDMKTSSIMLKVGSESEYDKISQNKEVQCTDICTLDTFTKEQILSLLTGSCKNCAYPGMSSKYHTLPTTKGEHQSCSRKYTETNIAEQFDKNEKNTNELIILDAKTSNIETSIDHLLSDQIAARSSKTYLAKQQSTIDFLNNNSEKESTVKLRSNSDKFDFGDFSCQPSTSQITHKKRVASSKSTKHSEESTNSMKDPVTDLIKKITRRYSKHDLEDPKRKKCFREIMNVFNYLLDTDDSTDVGEMKTSGSATSSNHVSMSGKINGKNKSTVTFPHKNTSDKTTQLSNETKTRKKSKLPVYTEDSSDIPLSSDVPVTSDDHSAYRILNRIKRECEKYQRRCKLCRHRQEISSSTSTHCEKCSWHHESQCRYVQKSKTHKPAKPPENSVAYNLIIQASDSMTSHDVTSDKNPQPLQTIIIKVPSSKLHSKKYEGVSKSKPHSMHDNIEKVILKQPKENTKSHSSKSLPNNSEILNTDMVMTVREYLEKNRPDFVDRTSKRQECLKGISESRARKRQAKQQLCQAFSDAPVAELCRLAEFLSVGEYNKIDAPKFTSEREMKKHSERIYKTLPEVVRKKEQLKKDRMKKTNLIMAQVFNKNLQKRTLKGSVDISNYSSIIKL